MVEKLWPFEVFESAKDGKCILYLLQDIQESTRKVVLKTPCEIRKNIFRSLTGFVLPVIKIRKIMLDFSRF